MTKVIFVVVLSIFLSMNVASAQEFEVSLNSSYVDTSTFNDRFSDGANIEVSAYFELGNRDVYLEAYAITGFDSLLNDSASEYGFEFGKSWEVSEDTSINLAAGRWMNYEGFGYDVGDWMFRLGVERGSFSVAATVLRGESDTTILYSSYAFEIGEKLSFSPSIAYDTEGHTFNPGFSTELLLSPSWAVGLEVVYPDDEERRRRFYYNLSIVYSW